ncbi:hypothetical protein CR162_04840 [Pseudoroseomonas rhizosphaerae]|uniref:Inner membrane protein YccF n=1 Tax=Teichococcus rhizosphaerae TaxID=1335062 RepID=A0A2C7AES3_9PROT|nr:YccF domain-containing protein [Pseudoroseomonas rhizosphaerae]PHK96163.1 hypothetical protein CR162_04840 [Pseudoroseomonas rhizosphaerae]
MENELALLLNILWNVFALGFVTAAMWLLAAVLMTVTIIGIPWARACVTMASYSFLPFGRSLVSREDLTGVGSIGTGPLGLLANLVWFLLAGIWLCISHLTLAAAMAVTIIGLPLAWAHLKLAGAAIFPVGKRVVPNEVADAISLGRGRAAWGRMRGG